MFEFKTRFSILIFLFISVGAYTQGHDDPADLVTDRPDQTESSVSVPWKSLQIETGFSYESGTYTDQKEAGVSYGGTLLRYGLFRGMELRLAMDFSTLKTSLTDAPFTTLMEQGLSPIALGAKIDLTEQKGWIPEIALIAHIITPVFDSDFSMDYAVPDIILAASHTISPRFSLGYNLGIEWADEDSAPIKKYSAVAGFGLSDRIGMYFETFGSFAQGELMSMVDGGITVLILPNLQFDISGGLGLTASSPDFFIGTGLSFRIPE